MAEAEASVAVMTLDAAGRYIDANLAALELLGVSLDEFRSSTADRFAMQPTSEADQAALRTQWETGGGQPLVGTAGLRRADGTTIRISYAVEAADMGFRVQFGEVAGSADAPSTVFTTGDVLREWRAAERKLAELSPGTPGWARVQREIEMLRGRYQELFSAAGSSPRTIKTALE